MCQQIIQFCSGSTKPLVFAGSSLTLILSIGLGYFACGAQSLLQDIDPALAQSRSLAYHLQLVASAYLILISVFACFAAHYDQKHSIRALAALTSLNFLLAVAAILLVPAGNSDELANQFKTRLGEGIKLYNFTLKPPSQLNLPNGPSGAAAAAATSSPAANQSLALPLAAANKDKHRRMAPDGSVVEPTTVAPAAAILAAPPLNDTSATALWDDLQARGCCGISNYTDWGPKLPKSCCSKPDEEREEFVCKSVDERHKLPCIQVIETVTINTKNFNFLLLLAFIALVNLYLANVTGISAYRTFHYNEASQNAYS